MSSPRLFSVLLAFCMFSTGASGLVNEYVLATMTTYILGNTIEQFSLVIASMMLMMGVSGLVQQVISDDGLIGKFIGLEIVMALISGIAPLAIYAAFAYLEDSFQFIHYFFVLAIGFLIGFEIPIVMRIIDKNKIELKSNLVVVYAMDYIGAFVGAIVWIKVLLVNFPLTEISFIVAGFNFSVAAITIIYFIVTRVISKPAVPIIALTLTTVLLIGGYSQNRDLSSMLEQKFYDDPIVHKETSKYQHLVLTESRIRNDVRLYINGNTQFSSTDEQRYHELLVHPALSINPKGKHVLILGGGDGLALREVLKYDRIESVTLIDLDPAMVKMSATHPVMRKLNKDAFLDARIRTIKPSGITDVNVKDLYLESEPASLLPDAEPEWVTAITVYNIDADKFIGEDHGVRWDTVLIDFPDPGSVELAKLYSRQFYHKLKQHLSSDAFIAIQSTSPFHAKEAYLSIGATLEASGFKTIPYRQNIPSFGDWGYYLAWHDGPEKDVIKSKLKNLKAFEVETGFITPEVLSASLAFGKDELVAKNTCINTVMNPCLASQYMDYSWKIE